MSEIIILNKGLVKKSYEQIIIPKGKNIPYEKCDIYVFLDDTKLIINNKWPCVVRKRQFLPICALPYTNITTTQEICLKMLYLSTEYRDRLILFPGYIKFGYKFMLMYNGYFYNTNFIKNFSLYILKPNISGLIVLYWSIKLIVWAKRFLHKYYMPEGKGAQKILKVLYKTK